MVTQAPSFFGVITEPVLQQSITYKKASRFSYLIYMSTNRNTFIPTYKLNRVSHKKQCDSLITRSILQSSCYNPYLIYKNPAKPGLAQKIKFVVPNEGGPYFSKVYSLNNKLSPPKVGGLRALEERNSSYYTDKDKVVSPTPVLNKIRTEGKQERSTSLVSITYEEIGLFPRSFSRVLDRFLKQLFSDVDNLVIQEYRFYRYLFLTTIKTIFILFFVPFLVNLVAKNYIVNPITEYCWNTSHPEIFLNSYEQKRAFAEFEKFEEKIYFETLVESHVKASNSQHHLLTEKNLKFKLKNFTQQNLNMLLPQEPFLNRPYKLNRAYFKGFPEGEQSLYNGDIINKNVGKNKDISKIYQEKTIELATYYNNHSIEAITNFFADLLSLCTLLILFITLEIQINITKSFLLEVFFGLDDSKKSLLILLITDLLVGYHSSNLWELFFEFIFNHYGIPESQTGIFLLVATLPVLLDVLFKYLIFRHLNRSSPATVATYQAIIE
jgi:hypothetical protein